MTDQAPGAPIFKHSPYIPYDPALSTHIHSEGHAVAPPWAGGDVPFEFTDWWDECLSWHENCYLHGGLNPTPTYRVKGPEALKFFSDICVNTFAGFPIGMGKHAIMANEQGLDTTDGVLLRLGEDDFVTYWMWPYVEYALKKGGYDAQGESLTGTVFLYQLGGPRALEVIEAATGQDLHDVKFMRSCDTSIDGRKVMVLRMGMAGSLAYEVHGKVEDALAVYAALLKAGAPFGITEIGRHAYRNTHTENGFPQIGIHHLFAADQGFMEFFAQADVNGSRALRLTGSMGPDYWPRLRNIVELGWSRMIKFDHDFVGREALEKEVANPRRQMVSLVWNADDILDVYRSYLEPGEPCAFMEWAEDFSYSRGSDDYHADQVLKDGRLVGISSGRIYSPYYRKMISLCSIDTPLSELGTEVTVLWGEPGKRQKEIRAVVSRFPYLDENRNEHLDVSGIPASGAAKVVEPGSLSFLK
jgi:glycine cleavage system aminomethyltransferase T